MLVRMDNVTWSETLDITEVCHYVEQDDGTTLFTKVILLDQKKAGFPEYVVDKLRNMYLAASKKSRVTMDKLISGFNLQDLDPKVTGMLRRRGYSTLAAPASETATMRWDLSWPPVLEAKPLPAAAKEKKPKKRARQKPAARHGPAQTHGAEAVRAPSPEHSSQWRLIKVQLQRSKLGFGVVLNTDATRGNTVVQEYVPRTDGEFCEAQVAGVRPGDEIFMIGDRQVLGPSTLFDLFSTPKVRFLPVSQYSLELASGVWLLECGVLSSREAWNAYRIRV